MLLIYADVVWLLNFCFDAMLLWLAAIMLKRRVRLWRLMLSALFGSLLVLLVFTPFAYMTSHFVTKLGISFVIVWICFGFHRFRFFIENVLAFYFATFMLGGGMVAFHFLLQSEMTPYSSGWLTHSTSISWLFVIIMFPILWLLSKVQMGTIREKKLRFEHVIPVRVTCFGQTVSLQGLVDSGNQLRDPLTNTPVMIVELQSFAHIFPPAVLQMIQKRTYTDDIPSEWVSRIRFVPYRAVGVEQQLLVAIKPDEVQWSDGKQWTSVKKVLIGFYPSSLSVDGEYNCIVHPHIVMSQAS
ncbi:peptidase [Anoxybacillus gonensis]|uniref:Sporulation sigma-E factor-processing peptidase n=1 Tax=Anoxybacillus gonensis TaxID=198467 RepID=A0AAW7TIY1_9BACL|nr:sigma-E processing peptidase SpoIIGA [Anoxybacillus gonensis]AKS37964.1 peptidase [Anoxybacillus gonensis]KGP60970.1 peptidase [Anoxybacillus gonensis]MDO0877367.1 sigma-E processing peptidase SpoIIGA [Anoxybacillus gonensis]